MGQLNVMGPQGDITIEWDPDDPKSVERAKGEWKALKEQGFDFFESPGGKQVKRFSKKLSKVVACPGVRKPADKKAGRRGKAMSGGPLAEPVG